MSSDLIYDEFGNLIQDIVKEDKPKRGYLGFSIRGVYSVEDLEDSNKYYVRFDDGGHTSVLHKGRVPATPNLPVVVKVDDFGIEYIEGFDSQQIDSFTSGGLNANGTNSGNTKHTHERFSGDEFPISVRLIVQLRLIKQSGMIVKIDPGWYRYQNKDYYFQGASLNLSSYVPASGHAWCTVFIDTSQNVHTIGAFVGNPVSTSIPLSETLIQEVIESYLKPNNFVSVGAVKLTANMTEISERDFSEFRIIAHDYNNGVINVLRAYFDVPEGQPPSEPEGAIPIIKIYNPATGILYLKDFTSSDNSILISGENVVDFIVGIIDLETKVSGILPIANGGTGQDLSASSDGVLKLTSGILTIVSELQNEDVSDNIDLNGSTITNGIINNPTINSADLQNGSGNNYNFNNTTLNGGYVLGSNIEDAIIGATTPNLGTFTTLTALNQLLIGAASSDVPKFEINTTNVYLGIDEHRGILFPAGGNDLGIYLGTPANGNNALPTAAIEAGWQNASNPTIAMGVIRSGYKSGIECRFDGRTIIRHLSKNYIADFGYNGSRHTLFYGDVNSETGDKNLYIDHPLDPENKSLKHSAIESPRSDLIYRGRTQLTNGQATASIDLESTNVGLMIGTFESMTQNARVVGLVIDDWDDLNTVARARIVGGNIEIKTPNNMSYNGYVNWIIAGERNDPGYVASDFSTPEGYYIPELNKSDINLEYVT